MQANQGEPIMHLAPFLDKYDTILFDLDGVITTEQMYWNTAALTVYEMLNSRDFYGNNDLDLDAVQNNMAKIRKGLFLDDSVIRYVKNSGVNTNWDLAYLVLGGALILGTDSDFEAVFDYIKSLDNSSAFNLYADHAKQLSDKTDLSLEYCTRLGGFWNEISLVFEEWYLGSKLFSEQYNKNVPENRKKGLYLGEEPLIQKDELILLLNLLKDSGKTLGIGSGRPKVEIDAPFKCWDIKKYFAEDRIINNNTIVSAESRLNLLEKGINLSKPHPYMFLKGVFGEDYDDEKILSGDYDVSKCRKTLVVGDAGCDIQSAKAAGCDFLAVLTGISGKDAKDYFIRENATYILDDVTCLMEV